jgi:steroid delta-isomerase-like uncharacterized protein
MLDKGAIDGRDGGDSRIGCRLGALKRLALREVTRVTIPDVVRKYVDAFGNRDVEGCVESFGSTGTYSDPGTPHPLPRHEISEHFAGVFVAFPDLACETVALDRIAENRVVWRWVVRGTNTGSYRGAAPTGRQVVLPGCEFIEVEDNLIHSVEGYFDRLTLMAGLGLVPSRPAPAST